MVDLISEAEQLTDLDLLEALMGLMQSRSKAGAIAFIGNDGPTTFAWGATSRSYLAAKTLVNNLGEKMIEEGCDPALIDRNLAVRFLADAKQEYIADLFGGPQIDPVRAGEIVDEFGRLDGYQVKTIPTT